jgi:hypothetical protein
MGDAGFKIAGNIRSASGEAVGACLARVYDSDTNELLDEQRVGSDLQMMVIYGVGGFGPILVTPARERAYVTVECDGHDDTYRSESYELADASYDQPIDLGVIALGD